MMNRPPGQNDSTGAAPRLAQMLLSVVVPSEFRDQQIGDLNEEFSDRRSRDGKLSAHCWYWSQAIRSCWPNVTLRGRHGRRNPNPKANPMEAVMLDVRHAARTLVRTPVVATVSILTLALAIGVNTAIFSLVNALVFGEIPIEDPGTVAILHSVNLAQGVTRGALTPREFQTFSDNSRSFSELAAWSGDQWVLTGEGDPVRVAGFQSTGNLFQIWGVRAFLGRTLLPDDELPGAPLVSVLSHSFWNRQFGSREDVVGSLIRLDGVEHHIVGVLAPDFELGTNVEGQVWVPISHERADQATDERNIFVTGRLLPGVDVERADLEIRNISESAREMLPQSYEGWEPRVLLATDSFSDREDRVILVFLVLTVGFILLIACANVANVLLARATVRKREVAVRAALGASRIRLVRQMLTESFLMAVAASICGLALSRGLLGALTRITGGQVRVLANASVDGSVLLFLLVVTVAAPLVFGTLPAFRGSAVGPGETLREGGLRSSGHKSGKTRRFLVGAQLSTALVLMILATLSVRAVASLQSTNLSIDVNGVLSMRLDIPESRYPEPGDVGHFYSEFIQRARGLPGVQGVALANRRPLADAAPVGPVEIFGRPGEGDQGRPTAATWIVSTGYLNAMRIPLLSGRGFTDADAVGSQLVALISRETGRRYFHEEEPVGQRIKLTEAREGQWLQVVGVVEDLVTTAEGRASTPAVYLPFAQHPQTAMTAFVRSLGDPLELVAPVREVVRTIDAEQPVDDMRTLQRAMQDNRVVGQAVVMLFVALALFALLMATVGVYGVMSYAVSQQVREIGIRMALGAEARTIRLLLLKQGGRVVAWSLVLGLIGGYGVNRVFASVAVGVKLLDPVAFVGIPAILAAVGLAAILIPTRRAMSVDPMGVLRTE